MVIHKQWSPADHDDLMRQVLAVLPGPGEPGMSTPAIRRRFSELDTYERENYVRRELDRLTAAGWVERTPPLVAGDTRAFWRRTRQGEEGKRHGALPSAD